MPWSMKSVVEISKPVFLWIRLRAQTPQPRTILERSRNQIRNSPTEGF